MEKHFVTFYSPGTFVDEETTKPVSSWDVDAAKKIAKAIKERHGATPFGFRFTTRSRTDKDLDSSVSKVSPLYYLGGKIETLSEVLKRATSEDEILVSNMRGNGIKRVITNTNSYRTTREFRNEDVLLDWP